MRKGWHAYGAVSGVPAAFGAMTFISWIALGGAWLLALALSSAWIQRLPVSTAAIYLAVGMLIGPWGFDLVRIDLVSSASWVERVTEIALILSLFVGGLRLRLAPNHALWQPAYRMASIVMVATIAGVAMVAWAVFDFPPALALLLGAILAPTDPVLAGSVTVGHADDRDPLRYTLSGEAGLNDGAAFPFVLLALSLLALNSTPPDIPMWALRELVWAIPGGIGIGFALGRVVGSAAIALRSKNRDTHAPTDFLALALIALAYALTQAVGALGFLAVFAAGIGLRRAEISTVESDPHPDAASPDVQPHPPAETMVAPNVVTEKEMSEPAVAAGVLVAEVFSFGDTMERLLEVLLVTLVGVSLATHWSTRGALLGLILIVVIRPLTTLVFLVGTKLGMTQRALIGWFGIRGVGSIYYLAYAISHGLSGDWARSMADFGLSALATSILIHGLSSQPLMTWHDRRTH